MPHIQLPEGAGPGIVGLMQSRPETAEPMNQLAEVLLRGPSSLTRGERELIATYVSAKNQCRFCASIHGAMAARQLETRGAVEAALEDPSRAPISDKMKALLTIAGKVQKDARTVSAEDMAAARAKGATDQELHDTVLIAAAFCMFNRYVDGLAAVTPTEPAAYEGMSAMLIERGYRL